MNYEVRPQNGYYLVMMTGPEIGLQVRIVAKDKQCSCGCGPRCVHVKAVREYLEAGGERAPAVSAQTKAIVQPYLFSECPVCGSPITYGKFPWSRSDTWHCNSDSSHYWLWRVEQSDGAIRKFLCGEGGERWQRLLENTNRVGLKSNYTMPVTQ